MIVRILGEGQYEVDESAAAKLDALDDELDAAVEAHDDVAFKSALSRSVEVVKESGTPVPEDSLHPAEVILPFADADVAEVLQLLADGHLSE